MSSRSATSFFNRALLQERSWVWRSSWLLALLSCLLALLSCLLTLLCLRTVQAMPTNRSRQKHNNKVTKSDVASEKKPGFRDSITVLRSGRVCRESPPLVGAAKVAASPSEESDFGFAASASDGAASRSCVDCCSSAMGLVKAGFRSAAIVRIRKH